MEAVVLGAQHREAGASGIWEMSGTSPRMHRRRPVWTVVDWKPRIAVEHAIVIASGI